MENRPNIDQNRQEHVALRFLLGEVDIWSGEERGLQALKVLPHMGVKLLLWLGFQMAVEFGALDLGVEHLPCLYLIVKIGVGDLRILARSGAFGHHAVEDQQTNQDQAPEHDRFRGRIHQYSSFPLVEEPPTADPTTVSISS